MKLCISIIILIIIILLIVIVCYNYCNTTNTTNKNNFYGSSVINSNICTTNEITKLKVNYVTSNGNMCASNNTNCANVTSIYCTALPNKKIIANITSMVNISKNASTRDIASKTRYKLCPLGFHLQSKSAPHHIKRWTCSPNNLSTIATRADQLYQRSILQ